MSGLNATFKTPATGVLLFCLLSLSACVNTGNSTLGSNADREAALKTSVQLARTYLGEGNWEAAKRHLRTAMEIDKRNAEVHEALALVFQNTGELELAEEHFQKALRLDRNFSRARNNYGVFLYQEQRYQDAAEQLERVTEDILYENRRLAFINLGRCYRQLQELDAAERAFRRAWLMDKSSPIGLLELSEIHFLTGQVGQSRQHYEDYRRQVDQQSARGLWLGIRIARAYEDRDAVASYALALRNLYPTSPEYFQYLKSRDARSAVR